MAQKSNQSYKIGWYIRVQSDNLEVQIKKQEDRLRQSFESDNFGEIKGVYSDVGYSAHDMQRPKLQELLRAVETGEINLIMVDDMCRLARRVTDAINLGDFLDKHGCRLLITSEPSSAERTIDNGSEK